MSLCHTSTKPILILVDRHWLWVLHACGYRVILHTCLPLYKTFWADATSIQPDTCIKMTSTTTTIVADRPRCQHSLFDVPLVDGHLVFGCAKLFAARHRTQRWATLRESLRQMVDRNDELGPGGVFCASMARCHDRDTGPDGRSRWFWYGCILLYLFLSLSLEHFEVHLGAWTKRLK